MSYTRRYHETVSKTVTVSYSYPASQSGGSSSTSVTVSIPVDINIHVDTNPFDASVRNCNTNVNLLTGSVVATEAAQIASIAKNAKRVAATVVDGFFGLIRSEISQQIVELSQRIDANLIHLRELAKTCIAKQKQMETDYNRISSRYLKIFDDLNNELKNRIYELNRPAFSFKNNSDDHTNRTSDNDLVSTVAIFGSEGGELQAKIAASIVKKRAFNAINQANIFLWKQKKLQSTINQSMMSENISATKYSPVCFMETNNENNRTEKNTYQADFLPKISTDLLQKEFQSQNWAAASKENKEAVQRYFYTEVNNSYNSNSLHDFRVKEMIVKIFDVNSIKTI